jgi:hypothetical protein
MVIIIKNMSLLVLHEKKKFNLKQILNPIIMIRIINEQCDILF